MARTPYKFQQTLVTADAGFIKTDSHAVWLFPDGTLVKVMGWNGTTYITNCYKNTNNGVGAWTSVASFPGTGRHWFTSGVIGNKGYVVGGDSAVDMYEYDYIANTWTLITAALDIPGVYVAGRGFDGTNFYIAGGQTQPNGVGATALLKLYRITAAGVVTDMGNLPLVTSSAGVFYAISSTRFIYIAGGLYNDGEVLNYKVIESINSGVSWTEVATLPTNMGGLFSTGIVWAGLIWYQVANVTDGLYYSGDFGRNWLKAPYSPRRRHASGMVVNTLDEFMTIGGLDANTAQPDADIYKYVKSSF